jgi:hypothetical protein
VSHCYRPSRLTADERERFDERAAIAEFDGRLSRHEAERLAAMELARPLASEREEERPDDLVIDLEHGVPNDRAESLARLLAQVRRLRRLGRSPACIRLAISVLNRTLPKPVPCFSPGGLCECLDALLAEESGGANG